MKLCTCIYERTNHWMSVFKFSMAFSVNTKNTEIDTINAHSRAAVVGRLSRLRNGPMIVKISPKVDEIKNLGNLSMFSQKLGMIFTMYWFIIYHLFVLLGF